jgi:hypothetical protein
MSGIEKPSARLSEEQRLALRILQGLLVTIGSANDAEDHGYHEDARQMRDDSCEAIQGLMAQHAFLWELLPTLQWELDSRHILGFGWLNLCDELEKYNAG